LTMTEVRNLSNNQYGLFATTAYSEGDVILTESPLVVLSTASNVSSPDNAVRSQFLPSSFASTKAKKKKGKAKRRSKPSDDEPKPPSILSDLLLPPSILEQLMEATTTSNFHSSTNKLRGMILALASYAANPPEEETKEKLFELYHPDLDAEVETEEDQDDYDDEKDAVQLANLALQCGQKMAAPESALSSLLEQNDTDDQQTLKLLLIYSCNAFEGGRVYHELSRVNHTCNPTAVVVEGDDTNNKDVSVLKSACDISPGDEISISYLGKYLFAGYPTRQRILRANKHFVCKCARCTVGQEGYGDTKNASGDLACRVPCPKCHPRAGRYLDDDVMFDEGDSNVCYAVPNNGMTVEERALNCPSCKATTKVFADGSSMKEKKEGTAIQYMCMAEDKVYGHLESNGNSDKKKEQMAGVDAAEAEREIDQQFLQLATSICGAQHWTTHFVNLSIIEDSLSSFHATLMAMGQDPEKDAGMMEEMYLEIAEAADGIERAYAFASSLRLHLDPAHWMFDYTVALARTLVGLGDEKSQKYGAKWIEKVEQYSERFENDGINKVVVALRDAWKRKTQEAKNSGMEVEEEENGKRRKIA